MDAAALLKSQGWRGKGHTLHPTDNAIGIINPLLVSRNTDGSGIGHKQHVTSDQWWLNAFDQKLKGLDTSKKGVVVQSVTSGALDVMLKSVSGKYTGLYASFVRGGLLEGSITPDTLEESTDATPASEDRESVPGLRNGVGRKGETKEERRVRKAAKSVRRAARAERRAAKANKAQQRVERKEKQSRRSDETKEERRARRAERKARKEARREKREEKAARKAAIG